MHAVTAAEHAWCPTVAGTDSALKSHLVLLLLVLLLVGRLLVVLLLLRRAVLAGAAPRLLPALVLRCVAPLLRSVAALLLMRIAPLLLVGVATALLLLVPSLVVGCGVPRAGATATALAHQLGVACPDFVCVMQWHLR